MSEVITIWRIASQGLTWRADDLSGSGAAGNPGRWNSLERPIVSSASSIALACLECVPRGSAGGCPQEAMTPITHGSTSPGKGLAQRVPVGLIVSNRSELGFTRRTSMNSVNQGR